MWNDPIVKEVRETRGKIAKDCNYNIHDISQMLQKYQRTIKHKSKTEVSVKV